MSINGVSISRFPDNDLHPTNILIPAIIRAFTNTLLRNAHTFIQGSNLTPQHSDLFGELVCFPVVSIQFVNQFDNYRIKFLDLAR